MSFIPVFELDVDTAASQLVAATFARSIQTFPLDSLLPEPTVVEPVDTNVIAVGEFAAARASCLRLLGHPFENLGKAQLDPSWQGATWSVYDLNGKTMATGVVSGSTLEWGMQGWPSGAYVMQLRPRRGAPCAARFVKAETR